MNDHSLSIGGLGLTPTKNTKTFDQPRWSIPTIYKTILNNEKKERLNNKIARCEEVKKKKKENRIKKIRKE